MTYTATITYAPRHSSPIVLDPVSIQAPDQATALKKAKTHARKKLGKVPKLVQLSMYVDLQPA